MALRALEEMETVQFGMEFVQGDEITPADFGSTFLDGAALLGGGLHGTEEVEAERFADELAAGAPFGLLRLLEVPGHSRGERDGDYFCGTGLFHTEYYSIILVGSELSRAARLRFLGRKGTR